MSQPESIIVADIRLAVGKAMRSAARLWRNHASIAWVGRVVSYDPDEHVVTLRNAQRIQSGLQDGASDLIGWRSIVVTPEMVGKRIAVFASPEVKRPGWNPPSDPEDTQIIWRDNVLRAGGIAGFVTSPAEAIALLTQPPGAPP